MPPDQIAKEIDALVNRLASAEYQETLVQLRDDLEFARRYHQVVLSSLDTSGDAAVRDTISSNVHALDEILARLDAERYALAERTDVTGMARQGYQVSLGDHGAGQWIAVFYAGHGGQQPLEPAGTAQAATPWAAVQRAAAPALR